MRNKMSEVVVVNSKGNVPPQELAKFIDRAKGTEMYAIYNDYNLSEQEMYLTYVKTWGKIPPGSHIWGAVQKKGVLTEDSYRDILDTVAKEFAKYGEEVVSKALTSTSASVFIPTIIAPGVIDVVKQKLPFYAMIPKKTMLSKFLNLPKRAADIVSSIDYEAEGTSALSPVDQTYTDINLTAKLLFVAGQLTHFAQATSQTTVDLYAQTVEDHFLDLQKFKEKATIRAEIASTGTWGAHFQQANGYDGIVKQIETAATNLITKSSAAISLANIDKLGEDITANNGEASAIIMDPSTFTYIRSVARDHQRIGPNDTSFGIPSRSFTLDGTPCFPSNTMPRTSGQKAAFAFDITGIEMRTLIPDTFFEVAQDLSPTKKFFFEAFEVFAVTKVEQCAAVINGT